MNPEGSASIQKMPVLFVGHGSPMNAIEENEFSRTWMRSGREFASPKGHSVRLGPLGNVWHAA